MKPVSPELRAVLDSAKPLPLPERVRRLRETAARLRYSESELDVNAVAANIEWAADELSKRCGYAALRRRLLEARDSLNKQDGRVRKGEVPSYDADRWLAITEWDDAKHAVINAVLAAED